MAQGLPVFPSFSISEPGIDQRWKKWCNRLDNLLVGLNIKDTQRKRALLLHYAGEDVDDIFDTLQDTAIDYETAKTKLTEYFAPKKSTEYEIYKFRQAKQEPSESMDSYHTRLRKLSENCEFVDRNKEIKSQIIQSCSSTRLRRKALRTEMSLDDMIKEARGLEISDQQASEIENEYTVTNRVTKQQNKLYPKYQSRKQQPAKRGFTKCRNCGKDYPHFNSICPASGKQCNFCKKLNHFETVCRAKQRQYKPKTVHNIESSDNSESEAEHYCFGLKETANVNKVTSKPKLKLQINGYPINILIDTGSSINIIDEITYNSIKQKPNLNKTDTKVYAYGSNSTVNLIGKFQATIETRDKMTTALFYVTKGSCGNLLSYTTSVELQIVPEILSMQSDSSNKLCAKYQQVFTGIGKLKDTQIDLHIDPNVQPVSQPHRRIPFHLREQVEAELKRLEDLDIIECVDGPTDWVSPIVAAPKPKSKTNEIRICVDMRLPNQAIKRTRHIIPTIDDMILDLNGAKFFSKLDLNQGYHQLEISESSRNITTFTTHVGLRRYKRLSFGINCAAEIFQNTLRNALQGLDGVRNISDDIIVCGSTQHEHDQRLEATFIRLKEKQLTLNQNKCEFNKRKLEFYGYVFGENGMSADPKKCETIKNTPSPTNVSEIRSFLAMTNYVSRFIPNYSTITEPLRKLIKKNAKWLWEKEQQTAFEHLKASLSSDTVVTYFDPRKETQVIVDASPVGVAAIMLQNGKVVCYASKSLTDVEKRYSQTEKESLAIVWAIEHWHLYLFGHRFVLISDAKALETIYNNPNSKPPARIERWRLRLQAYDFKVIYKPGESNMSDYLSRHPDINSKETCTSSKIAEEYLSFIAHHNVPKAMKIEEIICETQKDSDLQTAILNVKNGTWNTVYHQNSTLDTLSRCRNDLTVVTFDTGELLLHESKLVIPKSLQKKCISIAHEGHQGIVRMKQLLREKVYFPGIDKLVEETCKSCLPCLASVNKNTQEPLKMSKMPEHAFDEVSMDFCGPFPDGKYLLVIIDDYSRFPIVEVLSSINTNSVIPILDKIFSEFGVPKIVKSDNGAPMNSHRFQQFAEYLGFKHRKITPLWPQANGECERFMRSIGKPIRAAHTQGSYWKQDMCAFLRNYRATPHATTKQTQSELFFGRPINIKLPNLPIKSKKTNVHKQAKRADRQAKDKMKNYADNRRNAKPSNFKIGDKVLVKQDKYNKWTTPFDPKPYEITHKKGTLITAKRHDKQITRNSSKFKHVLNPPPTCIYGSDGDDDIVDQETTKAPLRRSTRKHRPPEYLRNHISA